jgi:hypothetical protein
LAQFRAADVANRDLWKSYRDQGLYTIENIWETVHSAILDFDIDITVGQKMIMAPGVSFDSLKLHDDYKRWFDRYNQATGGDSLIPVSQ